MRKIKREAAKLPLATSVAIFQSCNNTGVSKAQGCDTQRQRKEGRKLPLLNKKHKIKCQDWAKKNLKTDEH